MPINQLVTNTKPQMIVVKNPTQVYTAPFGTVTIPGGQWIPFAGFTYPQAIDVVSGGGVRP